MQQHRQTVNVYVRAQDQPALQQCVNDPSMKVKAFCAAGNTGVQDICFPYQSELKVNGGEVKANLRGLKNKPGSTRPADITTHLRLKPATYNNNVEFTYALTSKVDASVLYCPQIGHDFFGVAWLTLVHQKFYFGIYVCKDIPIETLVENIQKSKRIAKASVIQERMLLGLCPAGYCSTVADTNAVTKKASDPDVVATSQVLSLKDPLSYMRLVVPVRGLKCSHIQCFDATAYLQLQEQGPQWICPICNNPAPFEHLAVDE